MQRNNTGLDPILLLLLVSTRGGGFFSQFILRTHESRVTRPHSVCDDDDDGDRKA